MGEKNSRQKVLIIGIDSATADAICYLRSRGIYSIVTDYNLPDTRPEKRLADEYWMIDVADIDALEEACRQNRITNLFAGSNEFCLDQCMELCKRLDLPFYASEKGWRVSRDKELFKKICIEKGLTVPKQYELDDSFKEEDLVQIEYPVIIKPSDGNGRIGVYIAENEENLKRYYMESMNCSAQKRILVEEYVQGEDIIILCYIHQKRMYIFDVMMNHSIVVNGKRRLGFIDHNPLLRCNFDREVNKAYQKIVDELGCENGFCLFQGIFKEGRIYNTEFGFRIDGMCMWRRTGSKMGIDYLKLMINLALGEDNTNCFNSMIRDCKETCLGYTLWGKPGVITEIIGIDQIYEREDIIIACDRFKTGDTIPDGEDMRSIAFAMDIYGTSYDDIKNKIVEINNNLHVYDENRKDLLEYRLPDYNKWEQ